MNSRANFCAGQDMTIPTCTKVFSGIASIALVNAPFAASAQSSRYLNPPVAETVDSSATANPSLGAHLLAYFPCGGSGGLATAPMTTQNSGGTILVWVGRGRLRAFAAATTPTDNKSNMYTMLGSVENYSPLWPDSGEALYVSPAAAGGAGHVITASMPEADEMSLAVIEIKGGGAVQDYKWKKVLSGQANTSLSVTTTGPATLIAIWAGDSSGDARTGNVTAVPNNGFTTIDAQPYAKCAVEAAIAAKDESAAGSYDVTWKATPTQGAHLWLIAVQKPAK
jgi:hypothetical protein